MWVYLNDRFVSEAEANVPVFDHGFLYGDGLFETVRAYSGKIFALETHLERLSVSSRQLALQIPPIQTIEKRLYETLHRNFLEEAILRLTITRGRVAAGLHPEHCGKPSLVIASRPCENHSERYNTGVSCGTVSIRRVSAFEGDSGLKSLSFLDHIAARLEAAQNGFFEGIFLNRDRYLTEGTVSNLFWIRNQVLQTPIPSAPVLNGVTRQIVIDLARKNDITVEEGLYPSEDLMYAEEAFLTSTGFELMPLTEFNGRKIGSGQPEKITRRLHGIFRHFIEGSLE
ncbi:MAG: aminotransferase class IV [Nitrospiria bacterium]